QQLELLHTPMAEFKQGSNLTHSEQEALDELCRNKDIVIKPADKGGGLVIMPRVLYNHEVFRQLENTSYYQALPSDPMTRFQSEIEKFIQEAHFHQLISDKEMRYLLNRSPTRPVFYILPKVHKNLVNPPGRPIVAGNNSLPEPLSNFVDFVLRPLVTSLPSYLRDTADFLQCLETSAGRYDQKFISRYFSKLYRFHGT
uniref:Uncharacterized protein n=1 Tax=Sinocyclocheilus anshuiensis TaxID=1608454 RepID=A0A671PRP7_9TELE